MIKLDQAVIVEGKYDKIKLQAVIDALIITTEGFGIFNDKEKQRFISSLAKEKGILILTDSDSAGFKIRSFIKSFAASGEIYNAYIPDVYGKEKRKPEYSKEGKLGVEGIDSERLRLAIEASGIKTRDSKSQRKIITSADLYEFNLIGKENSASRRRELLAKLSLPSRLSSKALLEVLNTFIDYNEFIDAVENLST